MHRLQRAYNWYKSTGKALKKQERQSMFRFRFKFLADSYLLLFSFFLGMIGAALFFWWRYPVFPSYLFYSYGITGNKNFTEAFLIVIKQRFFQLGAGWLCGLTVYSVWLFGILTCFWSFSLGMGVIYFTLEKGLWGLPLFLRSLLPQGIFYLMVWYVLSRWSFSTRKRLRLPALAFLMLLTACGAAFEAYLFSF